VSAGDDGLGPGEELSLWGLVNVFGPLTMGLLREAFTDWRFTEKDGETWAIRPGMYDDEGPGTLIRDCVRSADPVVLGRELEDQEHLRAMTPEELEAEWHRRREART
jgi:hypothetical protein